MATEKKNGKAIVDEAATKDAPRNGEAKAHARLLGDRIRMAREQLGMLDYERAKLEAQAAQVRAQLARDLAEADALVTGMAKEQGIDTSKPGVSFDLLTGEFKS